MRVRHCNVNPLAWLREVNDVFEVTQLDRVVQISSPSRNAKLGWARCGLVGWNFAIVDLARAAGPGVLPNQAPLA